MKTIVSLTPIAVERDSRTYKQAASFARLGYRSVVVEAEPSRSLGERLPFERISVVGPPASAAPLTTTMPAPPRARPRAPAWIGRVAQPLLELRRHVRQFVERCRAVAAVLPQGDLYYLHSQLLFPAVWWRARRAGVPLVYDAHDLYWTLRRDGRALKLSTRGLWQLLDVVERLSAAGATRCVTVGDGVARLAERRFRRNFTVIRNAHDSRLDEPDVTDLRARLGLGAEHFLLAVSGNCKLGLAVDPTLRALAKLPDHVHLAFVGAFYDPFFPSAEALGVGDRVHFVPPVPPTQIVPMLRTADLAATPYYPSSPSVRHALPNGFFHAVAAGLPLLYPRDLVDLRELAVRMELGWEIDPQDPESTVAVMKMLLTHPGALQRRREHVRDVRDELTWEHEEHVLAGLICGLIGDCHTRRR